jgi:Helicase conserved C-terminal domain
VTFLQPVASVYVRAALRPFVDEDPDGSVCITPGSLRRAVETAHDRTSKTAEEIIATLERLHAGPLPEDVIALVRRWAKDWGRGAIAQVAILQVENAEIMQDLLEDADLRSQLQAVPGNPALATISPEDVPYVRALLQERGMSLGDTPDLVGVSGQDD